MHFVKKNPDQKRIDLENKLKSEKNFKSSRCL